jgi:tetratricopeptide (TPR) repeat protein
VHAARPFRGATMAELMTAVTHGRIDPPADTRAPAWISRVLRRGLATRPEDRYPTMDALLAALERGAARRRRRPILLALAALALVVAVLLGLRAQRSHACTLAGAAIADVWNDERAAALRAALLATDLPYAEASHAKAVPLITAWTADWSAARAQVCRDATINNTVSSDMYTQSAACLDEAKDGLAALLEVFVADSAAHVDRLVPSAAELPQLSACTDPAALARRPAPPDAAQQQVHALRRELLRERGRLSAGNYARTAEAAALLADAEALAYPPLVLAARALVAELARHNDDYAAAEAALRRVYLEAEVLGADEIAVTAAADLLGVIGRDRSRAAEALQWSLPAEVILQRIHQDRGLLGAHLFANRAVVLRSRGDLPEALEDMQRALEIREAVLGPDHPLIATTLNALGSVHRSRNALGDAPSPCRRGPSRSAAPPSAPATPRSASPPTTSACSSRAAASTPKPPHISTRPLKSPRAPATTARSASSSTTSAASPAARRPPRGPAPARARPRLPRGQPRPTPPRHRRHPAQPRPAPPAAAATASPPAPALDRVLKIRERQLGDTHPELITTLVDLGTVNYRIGDYPASPDPARARPRAPAPLASRPADRDLASSLRNLALVHDARGDTSHAFTLASEAVALGETALGHEHPEMATLLNTLGMLQRRRRSRRRRGHPVSRPRDHGPRARRPSPGSRDLAACASARSTSIAETL